MIKVVNKHKHTETEKDVYIGRGSIYGNPFTHNPDRGKAVVVVKSREEAIESYRKYFFSRLNYDKAFRSAIEDLIALSKIRDINLVCFCKPQSCHGDIIKKFIEDNNF